MVEVDTSPGSHVFSESHYHFSAENNGQQVAGHDDRPNYFLVRTNPDSGRSNNEYYDFFLPKEYRITLAKDHFDYTDIHTFDSNLKNVKNVKNAFRRCRVPFRSF